MFRLFLQIIRPSDEYINKGRSNRDLMQIIICLYTFILKQLQKSYLHYAISDTVLLDGGRIKIVHEFRDLEFENELKRNGIDVQPHMLTTTLPLYATKSKRAMWFSYFKFKNLLSIYVDDKELFIKHDSCISMDGTVLANVKKSSSSDIICRSILELKTGQGQESYGLSLANNVQMTENSRHTGNDSDKEKVAIVNKSKKSKSNSLFGKDTILESVEKQKDVSPDIQQVNPVIIEKRGFEIDATF